MLRRAPLKRNAPIKVKRRRANTPLEAFHLQRVAETPCLVSGQPATVHHVTSDGFKRLRRTHERIVPLAPEYHMIQFGPRESVEALGHAGFTITYGIDLLAEAERLWMETTALWARMKP